MTLSELNTSLQATGYPVTFLLDKGPTTDTNLPAIFYYTTDSSYFYADGVAYWSRVQIRLEAYSKDKDFDLEAAIEATLNDAGINWDKSETYVNKQKVYETLYIFEIEGGQ